MAKSDSFFIRARITTNGTTFAENAIDLGAYVDALGKSVLRIHNIQVKYGAGVFAPSLASGIVQSTAFQVTTQSQTSMVVLDDKSLIASGSLVLSNASAAASGVSTINDNMDIGPQHWTNGYLVGVEQIYLGTDSSTAGPEVTEISVVLECTVETLSQNAAMALALSQQ
tara:strand:- start:383 stop:889 length:507 start_codon:yes stop_codon:yes gene_type:complete